MCWGYIVFGWGVSEDFSLRRGFQRMGSDKGLFGAPANGSMCGLRGDDNWLRGLTESYTDFSDVTWSFLGTVVQ